MSEPSSAKANRMAEAEKDLRERKKYNTIVIVTAAVLAVLVVFAILFSSNLFYNTTTAVDINGVDFTVADFNYNYFAAYNNHVNNYYYMALQYNLSYLLPTAGTPLDDQVCGLVSDSDGKTTWADYFEQQALATMQQVAMLVTEAEKEGFTIPQDELDAIDETVEGMRATAASNNFSSLDAYLVQMYGKGMTEKVFRRNLERQSLAASYLQHKQDSFLYTADQLSSHYDEHKDEYDYFSYRAYWFSGAAVTDDADTEEDETMSLEDAMAKAEADAKAFDAAVTDEQSFLDYAASLNEDSESYDADDDTFSRYQGSNVQSYTNEDVYDWLKDPARKAGDHTVVTTAQDASTPGSYVVFFVERDNNQYASVNGWYGFIPVNEDVFEEGAEPEDEDEKAEAIKTANLATAKEVLLDFLNGSDHSVDAFAQALSDESETVTSNSEMEQYGRYDMPEEMSQWFYDPNRKEGDTDTIYVEGSGTYLVYFSGTDKVYADLISDTAMRTDDTNNWMDEHMTGYTAHKQWEMVLSKKMASLS